MVCMLKYVLTPNPKFRESCGEEDKENRQMRNVFNPIWLFKVQTSVLTKTLFIVEDSTFFERAVIVETLTKE